MAIAKKQISNVPDPVSITAASQKIPRCVGIIMDGNRRWAKGRGLPVFAGYREGYKKLKEVARFAREAGVHTLIVYAFSTENWKRPEEDLKKLFSLFTMALREGMEEIQKEHFAIRFIGERSRFPLPLQKRMKEIEAKMPDTSQGVMAIAVSYGGRDDIVRAVKALQERSEAITETSISKTLETSTLPNPELIIRTGGQHRLSNFLPWESIYSELYFSDSFWPDFSKEEFLVALRTFAGAQRNFGA